MSNGRNKIRKSNSSRLSGGFIAIPWIVVDSAAYQGLSHTAKALLLEIARQYRGDNNGRLLCSMNYMRPRGWKSWDVLVRRSRELLDAGFLHRTVQGGFPKKASWYAVTWQTIDHIPGYDVGAVASFERGKFYTPPPLKNTPSTPSPGA